MDLKMEVTQTLGLSQRMIQSTEILQMSAQELDTYLKELAVENPVVDIEEKFDKSRESERDAELQKKLEWLASSDEQNRVYYSEEYSSDDDDNQDMWNVSDNRGEDLAEYLISQLVTIPLTDKEQAIAEYLIDLLDSRGYLTEETDQIAAQLETEEDEVARMLQIVQSLEPAGVGARNLSECLLIQMDRQKIEDTIARKIAANYLEQLGKNQLPQIARKLTERRILTPAAYYASRGRKASNIKRGLPYAWDASTVADIMDRWREYLGHTVNFKTRKKSYKSKKVIHNPESEWLIFENTHDPIWTEAIADAARAARQTRRRPTKMGEMGMFSGMMFCADCGSVMYQCRATNFRREQEYYLCAGYRKSRDFCGQTHSIRTVILEELILENLREIVSFASRSKDEFVRLVMDSDLRQRDRDLAKRKRQLVDSEKRITELDAIFKRLYEDNISGKLSDERFQKLSADYEKEEQDLKVLTSSLRKEVELEESKSADVDRFLSVVERYTDIPELTPCILHEFVEKIIVHAASDPKGKNRTQEIDIYYKGIGALEMSKVTASMEK